MKTLTMTATVATLLALGSLAHAHPELGPEIRVVATPAQVTAHTYEREISAEVGLIPQVEARMAAQSFATYPEINPKVGYLPPLQATPRMSMRFTAR